MYMDVQISCRSDTWYKSCYISFSTVNPILRDHCYETTCLERPHMFQAESLVFSNIVEPVANDHVPVLRDQFFVAKGAV